MNVHVGSAALELGVARACAAFGLPQATHYHTRPGERLGTKRRQDNPCPVQRRAP